MDKVHYYANNGREVLPPDHYRSIFERATKHDAWMFKTFPGIVFTRRYMPGEFWPFIKFDKPDELIWVEVIRSHGGLSSRRPLGVTRGFTDGSCSQNN